VVSRIPPGWASLPLPVPGGACVGFRRHGGTIDSQETKDLLSASGSVAFVAPDTLLFRRGAALFAQRFDPEKHVTIGEPIPVANTVGFNPITFQSLFSASSNGVVALLESAADARPTWFDRQGNQQEAAAPDGSYNTLCVTRDQKRIIYDQVDSVSGNVDIWSRDLAGGSATRQTFDPAVDFYPVCAPSGDQFLFTSLRGGIPEIHIQDLGAPGGERKLLDLSKPIVATDWSGQGRPCRLLGSA